MPKASSRREQSSSLSRCSGRCASSEAGSDCGVDQERSAGDCDGLPRCFRSAGQVQSGDVLTFLVRDQDGGFIEEEVARRGRAGCEPALPDQTAVLQTKLDQAVMTSIGNPDCACRIDCKMAAEVLRLARLRRGGHGLYQLEAHAVAPQQEKLGGKFA